MIRKAQCWQLYDACHGEPSKSFDFECCLLNAAWLLLSLSPQLSQLGVVVGERRYSFFSFPCCRASGLPRAEALQQGQFSYDGMISCFLPFPGSPFKEKMTTRKLSIFFSMLSMSLKFHEINISYS